LRKIGVVVDVDLDHLVAVRPHLRDLRHNRPNLPTRSAPRRPKIDDHRQIGRQHFLSKIGRSDRLDRTFVDRRRGTVASRIRALTSDHLLDPALRLLHAFKRNLVPHRVLARNERNVRRRQLVTQRLIQTERHHRILRPVLDQNRRHLRSVISVDIPRQRQKCFRHQKTAHRDNACRPGRRHQATFAAGRSKPKAQRHCSSLGEADHHCLITLEAQLLALFVDHRVERRHRGTNRLRLWSGRFLKRLKPGVPAHEVDRAPRRHRRELPGRVQVRNQLRQVVLVRSKTVDQNHQTVGLGPGNRVHKESHARRLAVAPITEPAFWINPLPDPPRSCGEDTKRCAALPQSPGMRTPIPLREVLLPAEGQDNPPAQRCPAPRGGPTPPWPPSTPPQPARGDNGRANRQPSTVNRQPATVNRRPATGDQRPATGENWRPATGENWRLATGSVWTQATSEAEGVIDQPQMRIRLRNVA